jgi:hypothetical protein
MRLYFGPELSLNNCNAAEMFCGQIWNPHNRSGLEFA